MTQIIQVTDTHLFANPADTMHGVITNPRFFEVMQRINETESPDLLLLTGDLSQDHSEASYQILRNTIEEIAIPAYWIPGNHDDIEMMQHVFANANYLKSIDTLTLPNWQLIFFNTQLKGQVPGWLADDELEKLSMLLEKHTDKPIALIMHHHPIKVDTPLIDQYMLQNHDALWQVAQQSNQVKLIICGHVHGDYQREHHGITLESGPATCVQWRQGAETMEQSDIIGYKRYDFSTQQYQANTILWKPKAIT